MLRSLAVSLAFLWRSMPLSRMHLARWLWRTSIVSPSSTETTGSLKSPANAELARRTGQHYDQTIGIVCDASRLVTPGRTTWPWGSVGPPHREPGGAFILLLPYTFVGMTS